MTDYNLIIDGKFVAGSAGTCDVLNPATEQVIGQCPLASVQQADDAVAAARKAFPAWSALPIERRANLIDTVATALLEHKDRFVNLLTAEQGKPLDQAEFEVMGAVFTLKAFAAMRLEPKILRKTPEQEVLEYRFPLGVVAAITPWNFPIILLMHKFGPALLAGNTMVAKPAPTTPLTTLLFGEICQSILPAGVFNVICDANNLGAHLTAHPGVNKVAFTGSTATGKKILQSASTTLKRVTLELGGNDAAIVLDDVDPVATAQMVFQGAMLNAGQICVAIKRAYVPEAMYDRFCEELALLAKAAVVDDGDKPGTQIGPVQNKQQYTKLLDLLSEVSKTGTVIAGGKALERKGYFIEPTIVQTSDRDSRIVAEEQFGPILPVLPYTDLDEVIAHVNESSYGLAGTIWGKDVRHAMNIAARIDSGTVWVNQILAIDPAFPFRGAKQSGLGGELGEEGLLEYTQARIVNAALS
jgi:acyl-CoA reductase-like NAD-dependent aldehyde dehydrogenase